MTCLFALQTSLVSGRVRGRGGVCVCVPFWDLLVYFSVGFQIALPRNTLSNYLSGMCPARAF